MTHAVTTPRRSRPEARGSGSGRRRRAGAALAVAFPCYLALSVVLWWHVWSSHPAGVAPCGCDDPSLFIWFLEWPAYALAHGHNPFYSAAVFHPTGIDLLSNTSVLAIGLPLAPVTWLFGPVATLNVAATLSPALSALAMCWLLRRWVRSPAALVGGLLFGFSPFMVTALAVDHLMTSTLVLLPLMVGALDELLVRQRHRPVPTGIALGLLVVVEFFVSTEMLVIAATAGVVVLVALALYAGLGRHRELPARLRRAGPGLAAAAAVVVVLLAYPAWFALDGPAHLSGLVWPSLVPGSGGITLGDLWRLRFLDAPALHLFAGYEGPALPHGEYLGVGLLVVVGAGLVAFRRDRRLWFFTALGLVGVAFSLGVNGRYWVPWRVLARLPVVQNVTVARFMAVTTLAAAVLVAIVVDHTHGAAVDAVVALRRRRAAPGAAAPGAAAPGVVARLVGAALSLGVAAVAVVPVGSALATNVPLTVQAVGIPRWFRTAAPHLAAGAVVLTFPPATAGGAAMAWQAVDSLDFALATGTGPESVASRAGPERRGLGVLTSLSVLLSSPAPATAANVAAVRRALAGWGVTAVVVPDPAVLRPRYDRTGSTAAGLAVLTAALGAAPRFGADAWVWTDVRDGGPPLPVSAAAVARCVATPRLGPRSRLAVPDCVVDGARRR